ncbi:MAG: ribose 5-phosphate isomerase A [Candidatus Nitrosocaldaceae archaeon]
MKAFDDAAKYLKDGMIVGLGSGSTISAFLEYIAKKINMKQIRVIPTSLQIKLKAEELGLDICDDSLIPNIDLVYDGADEIDSNLNMIKGGGGALLKEKVVMHAAKNSIILAKHDKFVEKLSRRVPIEVLPYARNYVIKSINRDIRIRMLEKGYPFITENGNIILDVDFGRIEDPYKLEREIKSIAGVMEVGIFSRSANIYYRVIDNERFEIRYR